MKGLIPDGTGEELSHQANFILVWPRDFISSGCLHRRWAPWCRWWIRCLMSGWQMLDVKLKTRYWFSSGTQFKKPTFGFQVLIVYRFLFPYFLCRRIVKYQNCMLSETVEGEDGPLTVNEWDTATLNMQERTFHISNQLLLNAFFSFFAMENISISGKCMIRSGLVNRYGNLKD